MSSAAAGDKGVVEISLLGLAFSAALILVQCAVSFRLGLGLHSQLLVAGVRCVLQLSLLGYILVPIFNYGHLWLVLGYAAFMLWVSAVEAIGRPTRYYKGMFVNTLLIIAVCASSTMVYALLLIIGVTPWWSPQYLIPILGMVLGNTISGISIGLASVIEELCSGKDQIERLLALGASRSEATSDMLARSVKLAITPLLNQMSVVGLVSIPGMMTGQILSGSNPDQAARYQMVIMFLLGAASTAAAVGSVYAAVWHVVDGCHRVRPERLVVRPPGKGGVNGWINNVAVQVAKGVVWLLRHICWCCWPHQHHEQQRQQQGDSSSTQGAAATAAEADSSQQARHGPGNKAAAAVGVRSRKTEAQEEDLRQPLLEPEQQQRGTAGHLGDTGDHSQQTGNSNRVERQQ